MKPGEGGKPHPGLFCSPVLPGCGRHSSDEVVMYIVDAQARPRPIRPAEITERAESELRRNAYFALKNIACEYQNGVLILTGCLPTYYLKQVAQEAIARIDGVERVDNRIEVVSPSRRTGYSV
jgi:osmotically-inducible protein OsmY